MNFIQNPNITAIKIIAIAFITIIYSFAGILLVIGSDKYLLTDFYDKTDEDLEKKTTIQHMIETTIILALFGIIAYIGRNILQEIPFPLDGLHGFKYLNVKEVSSGSLLLWIIINYSVVLTNKIKIIRKRLII